jgi:hypothetical protein
MTESVIALSYAPPRLPNDALIACFYVSHFVCDDLMLVLRVDAARWRKSTTPRAHAHLNVHARISAD